MIETEVDSKNVFKYVLIYVFYKNPCEVEASLIKKFEFKSNEMMIIRINGIVGFRKKTYFHESSCDDNNYG